MKKICFFLSLVGIVSLSCSSSSPNPKPTATLDTDEQSTTQDGIPVQEFSLDNVNSIPAEEILIEVTYYGYGGGWDGVPCLDPNTGKQTMFDPTISVDPYDNELMVRSSLVTCGWEQNETLIGVITYPNGKQKTQQIVVDENGAGILSFAPNLDDPAGIYIYSISNGNTELLSNAYFYAPNVPRLYYLSENQILFHKFPPNEPVELVMFSYDGGRTPTAKGGLNFMIGNTGNLIVTLPDKLNSIYIGVEDGLVYVPIDNIGTSHYDLLDVGDYVGFAPGSDTWIEYHEKGKEFEAKAISYRACQNNINTSFSTVDDNQNIYQFAKVALPNVNLYSQPRYTSRAIQKVDTNQVFRLIDGPYCFDNAVWWKVQNPNELHLSPDFYPFSYIAEIDEKSNHYIEEQSCGELPSRISTHSVLVSYANGNMKNLRKQPGFSQEVIDRIPEGTLITVDEHWCVDDTYWWHVYTNDRQEGWMTEMQNGVYFLEPAPK